MTIENTFTVKTKRKEHPNASKYPGRPSMEFGHSFRNFLSDIGQENVDDFIDGKYIFEETLSADFFDSIQVGDVVGIGLVKGLNEFGENKHNEPAAYKFKILEIYKERDIMKARNVTFESPKGKHKGTELELAFEDLSCALGMGFGEILEREGKPYGVSEEIELKVKIVKVEGEDNQQASAPNTTVPTLPTATQSNSSAEGSETTSNSNQITNDAGVI